MTAALREDTETRSAYARTVTFLDVSEPGEYPICVPSRVLIDGDDVTRHIRPGRLTAPVRRVGGRRPIQPWAVDSGAAGGSAVLVVELVVDPDAVTVDGVGRRVIFAGHNLCTPPLPGAVEDLGEVELVPGHAVVRTIAEPWQAKALRLRFYVERAEFRCADPGTGQ